MPEVRRIRPSDVDAVVELVYELALHEQAPQECHLTAKQLHDTLSVPHPHCTVTWPQWTTRSSDVRCGS